MQLHTYCLLLIYGNYILVDIKCQKKVFFTLKIYLYKDIGIKSRREAG